MGRGREKGALLDPLTEMVLFKCIELFAEGIPAGEDKEKRKRSLGYM